MAGDIWRMGGGMTGSEDQCVVLLADSYNASLEEISRGKNLLVVVTAPGDR